MMDPTGDYWQLVGPEGGADMSEQTFKRLVEKARRQGYEVATIVFPKGSAARISDFSVIGDPYSLASQLTAIEGYLNGVAYGSAQASLRLPRHPRPRALEEMLAEMRFATASSPCSCGFGPSHFLHTETAENPGRANATHFTGNCEHHGYGTWTRDPLVMSATYDELR